MIKDNPKKYDSMKELQERERKELEKKYHELCNAKAIELHGEKTLKQWSMEYQGLWYLYILDDKEEAIEKYCVMKSINRGILSFATTKIADQGLYAFLEECMRQCFIAGDTEILDKDEYFIPAAMKFNAILEGKKAGLVKR